MSTITSLSTILTLIFLGIYGILTLVRHFLRGKNSLRNTEAINRYFLVSGGAFFTLALTALGALEGNFQFNNDLYFGLLSLFAGLVLILLGIVFLRTGLFDPLVQISEYSAEFGNSFIATRLPVVGGIELSSFAERFNHNVKSLANKISLIEIHLERLSESVDSSIENGTAMSNEIKSLSELTINFSEITGQQERVVRNIGEEISEFVTWYETSQSQLEENFIELRSLAEMGNLISVNAAVEASNLEIENPGLNTLAEKLHDLARSLEERQEGMRRLIDDVSFRYSDFRSNIEEYVDHAIQLTRNTNQLSDQVDDLIQSVADRELLYSDSAKELRNQFLNFSNDLPRSY